MFRVMLSFDNGPCVSGKENFLFAKLYLTLCLIIFGVCLALYLTLLILPGVYSFDFTYGTLNCYWEFS